LDTTIVGTINPAHLQTNLDILQQGPLPPELYQAAKQRVAAVQRYYRDRPLLPRIDDALRAAGVDPQTSTYRSVTLRPAA
jgi:hypothetical protein